jgi:hypothetical protein
MGSINKVVFVAIGISIAGCSSQSGGSESGPHPADVKPQDGAELAANVRTAREAHTQHYTDASNLFGETTYPMNMANPNCMDWWVYDYYLPLAPQKGVWSYYSTYDTSHYFASSNPWSPPSVATKVQTYLEAIPPLLGWNIVALKDHNSEVDRTNLWKAGKCTGRYVFQWDNHDAYGTNNFLANQYWISVNIPQHLVPGSTDAACKATADNSVPSAWVDIYVCEAPLTIDVGNISDWCGVGSGHWRWHGGAGGASGTYSPAQRKCVVTSTYPFSPLPYTAVVSFNVVVKTGVGHGVAPADISIFRSN